MIPGLAVSTLRLVRVDEARLGPVSFLAAGRCLLVTAVSAPGGGAAG